MQSRRHAYTLAGFWLLAATATAFSLPPNFYDESIADDWNQAVGLTFASDGRMLVWEKAGRVWIVENGVKSAAPLIDISEEVGDWRDYGLLGFALDPNFYTNGHIYLLYVVDYHHLAFFGTPDYDPGADWYFQDTIGRLTRYTCNAADGFRSVDYASRLVLVGESIDTGFPICHQSHGIGSLVFGQDGSLLASCGDAASYGEVDLGGCVGGSSCTCLSDGIITDKEDVGAYRSQLVDSLNGKVIRIDPATGNGLPSNPFYLAGSPRAPQSRVWSLGLRNPFRFTVRPGTGNADPSAADPGTIYLGDVGWYTWEEMSVMKSGAKNLGWPVYEGMDPMPDYFNANVPNEDAPNPLFGTFQPGFGVCNQQYFYFRNLIKQDTLSNPFFANPCNTSIAIPASIPKFIHKRPPVDWIHGFQARVSSYQGNVSVVHDIEDPASPVAGAHFGGYSSTGGAWYTGTSFPAEYQNSYFHGDFSSRWIRQFLFDGNDELVEVREFLEDNTYAIVAVEMNAADEALYYIAYDQSGCCMVRRISYVINVPPTASADGTPLYGPAPLWVQFTSAGSFDPDPFGGGLSFAWDFGDGSPVDASEDAAHVYDGVQDITAQGGFTARVFQLNPPHPVGGGNWDPEVMRDGDRPPIGNDESHRQYDTYHGGEQGDTDWVGYTFSSPQTISRLVFQEGIHFWDGGWFDTLTVQTLNSGVWSNVSGVTISPSYAGDNGISYETYELRFNPLTADGIRLYGNPGGSANFISVGELRVLAAPTSGPQRYDVTLTVSDALNASATASLIVSLNNTPPDVTITSPSDGSTWPVDGSPVPLTADISDAEHTPAELTCRWQTILHHNTHEHPEPPDFNCSSTTLLTPIGHEGETYFYEVELTVSDAHGLSTTKSSFVYPPSLEPVTPDPSSLNKTRFISFVIPAATTEETALRVRLNSLHHVVPPYTGGPSVPFTSFEGQVRWVGPPTQYVESSANGVPFHASILQCTPHYRDWSTVGLLHVTGSTIVPSSSYGVEHLAASCQGNEPDCTAVSAALNIATTRWGDVRSPYWPPDGTIQPDIADVSALVDKFRNAPGTPIKARGLLAGEPGNAFGEITPAVLGVDFGFSHISACVDAFRGAPYPYTIQACQ